jgi:hypothetical protein
MNTPSGYYMQPGTIWIGEFLHGSSGSHAGQFLWIDNKYAGANNTWYYQFADGILSDPNNAPPAQAGRNPPSGNRAVRPSAHDPNNPGGLFYSACC